MSDETVRIKAELYDLQYHTCDGRVSWPPRDGDHGCTLCARQMQLIAELQRCTDAKPLRFGPSTVHHPDPEMLRRSEADFAAGRARPIGDVIEEMKGREAEGGTDDK